VPLSPIPLRRGKGRRANRLADEIPFLRALERTGEARGGGVRMRGSTYAAYLPAADCNPVLRRTGSGCWRAHAERVEREKEAEVERFSSAHPTPALPIKGRGVRGGVGGLRLAAEAGGAERWSSAASRSLSAEAGDDGNLPGEQGASGFLRGVCASDGHKTATLLAACKARDRGIAARGSPNSSPGRRPRPSTPTQSPIPKRTRFPRSPWPRAIRIATLGITRALKLARLGGVRGRPRTMIIQDDKSPTSASGWCSSLSGS